jgi:hypothetical protein
MSFLRNPGRRVGLLYLAFSILGVFALMYVPKHLIVDANPTLTAANIAAHETLFRAGIACNLFSETLFLWVALALYDLFKTVNRRQALLMAGLVAVSVPIAMLNEVNSFAALFLVRGTGNLLLFDQPHRDVLITFFLNLHDRGFLIAGIFWGLWLFPLGLLVFSSGFIPRLIGILLMLNGMTYVIGSFASILTPLHSHLIHQWLFPFSFGELIFMLWILIIGATPSRQQQPSDGPPSATIQY